MPDAKNKNTILRFIVDDDMRLERVGTNWRVQFFTHPDGAWRLGKKRECALKAIMIAVGLINAELIQPRQIDRQKIVGGCFRKSIR